MSGIPLSGTIKPYPLETSNHLMTPVSSMTLAASSPSSPPAPRSTSRPPPGPFDPIPSDAMTPQRRRSVQALLAHATNPDHYQDIIRLRRGKTKMHSPDKRG